MCAMRTGAGGTDDYLAEWRKADPIPVSDDLEAEADKAMAEIDATYDRERLVALVKAGGKDRWLIPAPTRNTRRPAAAADPGDPGQEGRAQERLQAGRRLAAAPRSALLRHPAVGGAPFAAARMVLFALRRHVPAAPPAVEGHRLRPRRGAGEIHREARQGLHVRLPHVRPVRAVVDRHVLPDELPQAAAQRPLRRRARQRQLRGRARHALRLGQGLGRLAQHGQWRRDPRPCRSRSTSRCARPRPGCA